MAIYVNGKKVAGNGVGGSSGGGTQGPPGPQGEPGKGVPVGGTMGQLLAKASAVDYDTHWIDAPEAGGSTAGVACFNGRTGAVVPQAGDYTAALVGAIPTGTVSAIQSVTQAEYEALSTKDAKTLYLIKE